MKLGSVFPRFSMTVFKNQRALPDDTLLSTFLSRNTAPAKRSIAWSICTPIVFHRSLRTTWSYQGWSNLTGRMIFTAWTRRGICGENADIFCAPIRSHVAPNTKAGPFLCIFHFNNHGETQTMHDETLKTTRHSPEECLVEDWELVTA